MADDLTRKLTGLFFSLVGLASGLVLLSLAYQIQFSCAAIALHPASIETSTIHCWILSDILPFIILSIIITRRNLGPLPKIKTTQLISKIRQQHGTMIWFCYGFLFLLAHFVFKSDVRVCLTFAACSGGVLFEAKCFGKMEDSLAVAHAVIQQSILIASLVLQDGLRMKALAIVIAPIIPAIVALVTPEMEKLCMHDDTSSFFSGGKEKKS